MISPLSLQQEWLWAILREEKRWNFLTAFAWRLTGPLQVDLLKTCLGTIVRRHACLRTRIVLVEGIPKQQVDEAGEYVLEVVHLDGRYDPYSYVSIFFSRYFDLENGPIFQTRLLRLADEEHVLAIAIHHLVTDAVSVGILFRELWTLYGAYIKGQPAALDPVRGQYAGYATSQWNERSKWIETHAPYWNERLCGASRLRIPAEAGLEDVTDPQGLGYRVMPFGASLTASVNRVSRAARTTPALAVFALYAFAMSQFCAQKDLVISNNVSGRDNSDLMGVMGYFVHLVPMRIQLQGHESFLDLLALVSHEFQAASEHLDRRCVLADFPEICRGTFFQWISSHPHRLRTRLSTGEGASVLSVDPFPVIRKLPAVNTLDFDAGGGFYETHHGITGTVGFRRSLCSSQRLDLFCRQFRLLVESAVRQPLAPLAFSL